MMLLTAIILLIGFIALAGMVSRVSLLAQQAGREQDRPLLREIEPLQAGLNQVVARLGTSELAMAGPLEHFRVLEASRGFIASWSLQCASTTTGRAYLTLSDGELRVTLRSTLFTLPTATCVAYSG